ncbi:hypothetical protein [uncultured Gulosibacter sp.]|uniref:hypothetical protein n=1 Tax=uncultured Gulosibacter sp. TaxID=1339167 RepID=UPI00288C5A4F|nr:hypothetical protein [uncultured Gulosibacter sp.]
MSKLHRSSRTRQKIIGLIVAIDAFLLLFPPLHWWLLAGSPTTALLYVIGVPVLLALSLLLLDRITHQSTQVEPEIGAEV